MDSKCQASCECASRKTSVMQAVSTAHRPARHTVRVVDNVCIAPSVYVLSIEDNIVAQRAKPAQFVNLYALDGLHLLPRPFGVCRVRGSIVDLMFAVVGEGTMEFSTLRAGDFVDVLGPLGKPFEPTEGADYLLVGGGLGVPPLLYTAQYLRLVASTPTSSVTAYLGYRDEPFADEMMRPYVDSLYSITNERGTVVDLLDSLELAIQKLAHPVMLSCGPIPMMKALAHWAFERHIPCQLSLEERMACGYGTCVACVVDTVHGRQKVCTAGPVFTREELGWE